MDMNWKEFREEVERQLVAMGISEEEAVIWYIDVHPGDGSEIQVSADEAGISIS